MATVKGKLQVLFFEPYINCAVMKPVNVNFVPVVSIRYEYARYISEVIE